MTRLNCSPQQGGCMGTMPQGACQLQIPPPPYKKAIRHDHYLVVFKYTLFIYKKVVYKKVLKTLKKLRNFLKESFSPRICRSKKVS